MNQREHEEIRRRHEERAAADRARRERLFQAQQEAAAKETEALKKLQKAGDHPVHLHQVPKGPFRGRR